MKFGMQIAGRGSAARQKFFDSALLQPVRSVCVSPSTFFVCTLDVFVNRLLTNSFEELLAFQRALKEFVGAADPVYSKQYEEFFIALEGRQVLLHCSDVTVAKKLKFLAPLYYLCTACDSSVYIVIELKTLLYLV